MLAMLGALIRLVVVEEHHQAPITTAALTMLGLLYVPFLFNFVALLAFMPGDPAQNRFLLIYLLAVTKFSDVGAYVVGSLIGRHKMIPRISPGKTWEGFAGAIVTSLAISVALTMIMDGRTHLLDADLGGDPRDHPAAGERGGRPGRVGGEARCVDQGFGAHDSPGSAARWI